MNKNRSGENRIWMLQLLKGSL